MQLSSVFFCSLKPIKQPKILSWEEENNQEEGLETDWEGGRVLESWWRRRLAEWAKKKNRWRKWRAWKEAVVRRKEEKRLSLEVLGSRELGEGNRKRWQRCNNGLQAVFPFTCKQIPLLKSRVIWRLILPVKLRDNSYSSAGTFCLLFYTSFFSSLVSPNSLRKEPESRGL